MIHRRHPIHTLALSTLLFAFATTHAWAADGNGPYSRVSDSENGDVVLEMCERAFVPINGDGPRIHLVSAIHIADKSFYKSMQALLESYDSVLFEGVKPAGLDAIDPSLDNQAKANATTTRLELLLDLADMFYQSNHRLPENITDMIEYSDTRISAVVESIRVDGWGHPIGVSVEKTIKDGEVMRHTIGFVSLGADKEKGGDGLDADIARHSGSYTSAAASKPTPDGIQALMARALRVAFQLDEMDMAGKGWINADIDINTLQDQLAEMGEDNAMILQLIEGNSFQAKLIGFVLKFIERSPTMSSMMKLAMMDMLALVETSDIMSQFDVIEDVILHGRNDIVIEYLKAELLAHPEHDDIAIFYGAAHMPGIEEVILNELGYKFESNTWAQAMTVNMKDTGLSEGQIKMMRNMIKSSLEKQF